jgi:hypothetical protein
LAVVAVALADLVGLPVLAVAVADIPLSPFP